MALAVVVYPTLSSDDLAWIQSVRRRHDRLYFDLIRPHITLVFPTEEVGESTLRDHARLYAGCLANELRLDLPFVPHLGIAKAPEPETCKQIVDELNGRRIEIHCRADAIDLIGDDGRRVWTIDRMALRGRRAADRGVVAPPLTATRPT